ncbi:hypothetical protein H4W32_006261 [Actinophytocola algeriensis]|uniref:Uncharacterized protein n=1 Tax=Actinophytocola algeriensis TaxID=1768010 RepID=A0A7W7Q4M3_9PSEU|nr:hypothetical protein [Actinophytocola algeriensis]MBE1478219.1 hypothetical protein [Actinophytocola algeriensis]
MPAESAGLVGRFYFGGPSPPCPPRCGWVLTQRGGVAFVTLMLACSCRVLLRFASGVVRRPFGWLTTQSPCLVPLSMVSVPRFVSLRLAPPRSARRCLASSGPAGLTRLVPPDSVRPARFGGPARLATARHGPARPARPPGPRGARRGCSRARRLVLVVFLGAAGQFAVVFSFFVCGHFYLGFPGRCLRVFVVEAMGCSRWWSGPLPGLLRICECGVCRSFPGVRSISPVAGSFGFSCAVPRFADGRVSGVDGEGLLIFLLVRGGMCKLLAATLGVALCSTARPMTHPDGGTVGQKS